MDEQVKYTEQEVANLSQTLRGFLRPVQHELHEQGMSVTWILPEVDWETLAESILQRDAAVRAETQQRLTDAQGEVKRLRARFGAVDGRLAAAEKLYETWKTEDTVAMMNLLEHSSVREKGAEMISGHTKGLSMEREHHRNECEARIQAAATEMRKRCAKLMDSLESLSEIIDSEIVISEAKKKIRNIPTPTHALDAALLRARIEQSNYCWDNVEFGEQLCDPEVNCVECEEKRKYIAGLERQLADLMQPASPEKK